GGCAIPPQLRGRLSSERSAHPPHNVSHRRLPWVNDPLRPRPAPKHALRLPHAARPSVTLKPAECLARPRPARAAAAVEPQAQPLRAAPLRRVPAPGGGDELPRGGPVDPRGARGAVPAGGEEGPRDLDRGSARRVLGLI